MLRKKIKNFKRVYIYPFDHNVKYLQRKPIISKLIKKYKIKGKLNINIIIITIECLRKDHLSIYGYKRKTTPFLESIKNKLAIFTNAKASSSYTWPSIASLITGLPPSQNGARKFEKIRNVDEKNLPAKIKDEIVSIPEIFDYLGGNTYYNSGGLIFAELVASGRYKHHDPGLKNHVDVQVKAIMNLFDKYEDKPIFAHIHVPDTHYPLYAPEEFRNVFNAYCNEDAVKWKFTKGNVNSEEWIKHKDNMLRLYDSSILYIDSYLSNLYYYLENKRVLDNTIVFITTDHGEEFWDHAELEKEYFYDPRDYYGIGHGHNMFNEITDIPLFSLGYDIKTGLYENFISVTDISATILKLLEIEHNINKLMNKNIFDKKNLNPYCEDIAYGYDKIAYWKKNNKYLISEGDNIYWMFEKSDHKEIRPKLINFDKNDWGSLKETK